MPPQDEHSPIYLDYNATTPVHPEVVEAMLPFLRQHFGNPSSAHTLGQRTRRAIEGARAQVAALLECRVEEVIFTSGGTESNNLAIRGAAAAAPADRRRVLTTTIEHPATVNPCRQLEREGWSVAWCPVDGTGRARLDEPEHQAGLERTALVTVMHANNEVGTLQPVAEVAAAARAAGALVHTDAAQSVGKVPTRVDDLGVDLLSVAGHKLYAPKGVGALYVRQGTPLQPVTFGAGHERGLRPGTENVTMIVGLGRACALAEQTLESEGQRIEALRERLWGRLEGGVTGLRRNGALGAGVLPNTLNVSFPGVLGGPVLAGAPHVLASTGAACHSPETAEPSAVLTEMGVPREAALGTVRLSLGHGSTEEEVDEAAAALIRAFQEAR